MPEAAELGPEKRMMLDVSDAAFSIAAGLRPHPDELTMTKCARCPVCRQAFLATPGEVVPEHGKANRRGRFVVCQGVGQAAIA